MNSLFFRVDATEKACQVSEASGFRQMSQREGVVYYLDGWTDVAFNALANRSSKVDRVGSFNLVVCRSDAGEITVLNDTLGQRPLYIYAHGTTLIASNDFWRVWESIPTRSIDYDTVKQYFSFRRVIPPWRSFDKSVLKLPPGSTLAFKVGSREPNLELHELLVQQPDDRVSVSIAAEQLDDALRRSLEKAKEVFPERKFWFGNSGGLDSRVIPHYAAQVGLSVRGFSVTEKRPHGLLNQSLRAARRIQGRAGVQTDEIEYSNGTAWNRLVRDLRVNPHGPANFHKNPEFWDFLGDVVINGGNSFLIANDDDFWKDAIRSGTPALAFARKHLGRSKGTSEDDLVRQAEIMETTLRETATNIDDFSLMRCLHQMFLNSASPVGGFESMNFAGDFHYIYHPYGTKIALRWPQDLFYGRRVQTELLARFVPEMSDIRDQHGQFPISKRSESTVRRKLRLRAVGYGLSYNRWLRSPWFHRLLKDTKAHLDSRGSAMALNAFRRISEMPHAQDRLDMLKLSVALTFLENGESPTLT